MRVLSLALPGMVALLLTACGGRVIVDGPPEGIGGAGVGGGGGAGGGSSSSHTSSSTSGSTSVSSSGSGVACPTNVAIQGSCPQEGQICPIPHSCCSGKALCKGGIWHFGTVACGQPCTNPCGPENFACQLNAVCVAYLGKTTTYECRDKPCPGSLACGCADPLCAEQGMTCNNIQDGYKILCD